MMIKNLVVEKKQQSKIISPEAGNVIIQHIYIDLYICRPICDLELSINIDKNIQLCLMFKCLIIPNFEFKKSTQH